MRSAWIAAACGVVAMGAMTIRAQGPPPAPAPGDCRPSALNVPEAKYPCVYPDNRALFRVVAPDCRRK